jgi:hypothetical protein
MVNILLPGRLGHFIGAFSYHGLPVAWLLLKFWNVAERKRIVPGK